MQFSTDAWRKSTQNKVFIPKQILRMEQTRRVWRIRHNRERRQRATSAFSGEPLGRPGGRFWILSSESGEDSDDDQFSDADSGIPSNWVYRSGTPKADPRRNLTESSSRAQKRMAKRVAQLRLCSIHR
jgi:hypothetical protein